MLFWVTKKAVAYSLWFIYCIVIILNSNSSDYLLNNYHVLCAMHITQYPT